MVAACLGFSMSKKKELMCMPGKNGGRKPKPTSIKVLEGNPGGRPINENEAKPSMDMPKKPPWLKGEAAKMWKVLGEELNRLGLMSQIDGHAFAMACSEYGIYVDCMKIIGKEGMIEEYVNTKGATNRVARPEISIANKSLAQFKTLCTEFGLTPASRTRIDAFVNNEKPPQDDFGMTLTMVK
jgi:P27 family predicted phage terminase small subunit